MRYFVVDLFSRDFFFLCVKSWCLPTKSNHSTNGTMTALSDDQSNQSRTDESLLKPLSRRYVNDEMN